MFILLGLLYIQVVGVVVVVAAFPIVIWHGLGDTYASPGILNLTDRIKQIHPAIFVHSLFLDKDLEGDRRAGFYGDVNSQVDLVSRQLSSIPELHAGFDAIGLSQGGQFLRAYAERYNSPPVRNLITFGSQHMGISDIPPCKDYDYFCQVLRRAAKGAVYSDWVQKNIVQAQYYRDPRSIDMYLKANHFLTSINNELDHQRNATYARNLASLNRLVLVMFTEDTTVIPKESSWFGSEAEIPLNSQHPLTLPDRLIIPMRLQPLYLHDWIGLRALDEKRRVVFETCQGEHMHMSDCWERLVRRYLG